MSLSLGILEVRIMRFLSSMVSAPGNIGVVLSIIC